MRTYNISEKHNKVKLNAFLALYWCWVNYREDCKPSHLSWILGDMTTNNSLRQLLGRWVRWGFCKPNYFDTSDGRLPEHTYKLTRRGLEYLNRHIGHAESAGMLDRNYIRDRIQKFAGRMGWLTTDEKSQRHKAWNNQDWATFEAMNKMRQKRELTGLEIRRWERENKRPYA